MDYEQTSPFFVETKGYIRIRHLLDENHIIVIKGNPGDGKTSLAMHVMFDSMKQGKRPLQIHRYTEFDEYVSPNRNPSIFIDNLFGELSVSKDDVAQWSNRFKALQAAVCDGDRRNNIVIAIQKDIYNESRKFLKSNGSKFGLNSEEMRQMFTNYTELSFPERNFSDSLPNLGFPQCCRLYRDTQELRNQGLVFFKNPLNFLIKELHLRLHVGGALPTCILYDNSKNKEVKFTSMKICSVDKDLVKFQRAIDNNTFATAVQMNNEENCLKFKNLFSKVTDEEHVSLLVYFSAVGCIEWVKNLLHTKKISGEQAFLALKMARGANELNVVKFIITKGCTPNIECCFNAIKGGHLDVIFELEKSGVDLTETCETQTHWSTKTSVLDKAAMQNQCHLIESLLKNCPDLIRVKSSIGATPIYFAAEAGDIAFLKKIIKLPRFLPFDVANNGSTILHFACQNNKYEAVQYTINAYPQLLFSDKYYCFSQGTILHTAAQSGNSDLFKYVFRQI
ncbi:unnamed protein product [Mytilus coruscus]|uniref:Novel STAND NTPase 3 domain-containing protein n=1 Tax=Mytilus coruscus TaxID=42192 RepID=A0A6J8BGF1_MYTCO|nr:unnamed protein product [Mytilus coruscus]